MQVKIGEIGQCPHCGESLDEVIENYIIHGRGFSGSRCATECDHCYESFSVEQTSDTEFLVEAE